MRTPHDRPPRQSPASQLPDRQVLADAAQEALEAHRQARERLGRVVAVVSAAAVRDVPPDADSEEAPLDATHAELTEAEGGDLFATGRYWTADGQEHVLCPRSVSDVNEWVTYLGGATHDVWSWLVTDLPDRDGFPRLPPGSRQGGSSAPELTGRRSCPHTC